MSDLSKSYIRRFKIKHKYIPGTELVYKKDSKVYFIVVGYIYRDNKIVGILAMPNDLVDHHHYHFMRLYFSKKSYDNRGDYYDKIKIFSQIDEKKYGRPIEVANGSDDLSNGDWYIRDKEKG